MSAASTPPRPSSWERPGLRLLAVGRESEKASPQPIESGTYYGNGS